ncbi:DNA-binding response regulator, OmpR family [Thermodesulfobium acidiphilum]|uniref:DNA-binding response regulator, OmpR family n=1 Tax=Thermodesulfobium acidiphilum TaxID=1794699 RepID=A0A2R4W2Q1_THEAF|nr:response regulator transcription factor [Thermodesulfobium acidiphilum]AWB11010.1 DNA-binding response regulator, OmpR family [Thermodesulfobium acidiphilum]
MEKEYRILVVEDEYNLARYLQLELEHEGYLVDTADNGYEAIGLFSEKDFDLVLLDLMIPGIDGFEVCKRMKSQKDVAIIILTARDAVKDKVKGLDLGADDYVTKPFVIEELIARIRARLRKGTKDLEQIVVGDLVISPQTREVKRADKSVSLSKKEFDLLKYLAENVGKVLNRDTILNHVWGYDYYGSENVVDVYIRYLRAKIDDPFENKILHTVRGVGYALKVESNEKA